MDSVAAVSVGIVDGVALLDLDYPEDVEAEVDMNVVMTGGGRFVEVQGTGEEATFSEKELNTLVKLAKAGIAELHTLHHARQAVAHREVTLSHAPACHGKFQSPARRILRLLTSWAVRSRGHLRSGSLACQAVVITVRFGGGRQIGTKSVCPRPAR